MISNIIFLMVAVVGIGLFVWQIRKITQKHKPGPRHKIFPVIPSERLNKLLLVAFGQQKMFKRPWPAILHGCCVRGLPGN